MINVTKPYLPPAEEYNEYLSGIWKRGWLTNHGPLVYELENQLRKYLQVKHLCYVSSGTVALQIALKSLALQGEVITTAFSHISTVNVLLWENLQPVFVDIDPQTFCIDAAKIEAAITDRTCAILATHVYGYPCDVEQLQAIAKNHNIKLLYDGAQSFGVKIGNQSVFDYGDVSTVSFHATKVFHTIEGGAIISNDEGIINKCLQLRNFGLKDEMPHDVGINGKNSEFHAAMGLCNLPRMEAFIAKRQEISNLYKLLLEGLPLKFPVYRHEIVYNFVYFPVLFSSEEKLIATQNALASKAINARRYFYPALNKLPYYSGAHCPVAENLASRVLCLPLYYDLTLKEVKMISLLIIQEFQ